MFRRYWISLITLIGLMIASCAAAQSDMPLPGIPIPAEDDWVDFGMIFPTGELGDWDLYLWGAFAASAVKYEGRYYFYYQGASGYQTGDNETVTGRAVGLAVSEDGIRFTKSEINPVLTWSPNDLGEEGATSTSVVVVDDQFVMIYGANTAINHLEVNADGRWATSDDGIHFVDQGIVLDHTNRETWGFGDELFPIILIHDSNRWFTYYIPNGVPQRARLGAAWGDELDQLAQSQGVTSTGIPVNVWGPGSQVEVEPGVYVVFITDGQNQTITTYAVSLAAPAEFSPLQSYSFENSHMSAILLDRERRTWFMYYPLVEFIGYGVRLAPAGAPDLSPPTVVSDLTSLVSEGQTLLSWHSAQDEETGVAVYNVYKDSEHIAAVKNTEFVDPETRDYAVYEVSAVNFHNVESESESIIVVLSNQPPVVINPGDQTVEEEGSVSIQIAASDPDGDSLTYSATGLPGGLTIHSETGLISGTVAAGASSQSPYTVTVTVTDDGTPNLSRSVTFKVWNNAQSG